MKTIQTTYCKRFDNSGNVCSMSFVSFSLAVIFIVRLFSTSAFRVPRMSASFLTLRALLKKNMLFTDELLLLKFALLLFTICPAILKTHSLAASVAIRQNVFASSLRDGNSSLWSRHHGRMLLQICTSSLCSIEFLAHVTVTCIGPTFSYLRKEFLIPTRPANAGNSSQHELTRPRTVRRTLSICTTE